VPGDIVRIRRGRWRVVDRLAYPACTALEVQGIDGDNRGIATRFLLPFEPCETEPRQALPRHVTAERCRRLVRMEVAQAWPRPDSLRTAVRATFRPLPFQLEPALAFLGGHTVRVLLADGVGLGKTVQAGLLVAELLARQPDAHILIVTPAMLRTQWRDELAARFGIHVHAADAESLQRWSSGGSQSRTPWTSWSPVIVSIDLLKRPEVLRSLEPVVWDLVVFDEAHHLASDSDRYRAASLVAGQALGVLLLSATPHHGDDGRWRRLCGIGDIDGRFPLRIFRRTHAALGGVLERRSIWLRTRETTADRLLREALLDYARRVWREQATPGSRLAVLVLLKRAGSGPTALARSLVRRRELLALGTDTHRHDQLDLPLGGEEGEDDGSGSFLGSPGFTGRAEELDALDALIALASSRPHDCGSGTAGRGKLSALARFVWRTREPVIVFTQYRDTLEEVVETLAAATVAAVHGGLSLAERTRALHEFTSGAVRVLAATDAASEGLNLHARCRLIVCLDLPWTPVRLEQRIGRVDRIGQARRVHAVALVAGNSYEELVAARLRDREATALAALAAAGSESELDVAASVIGVEPQWVAPRAGEPEGPAPELAARAQSESARIRYARSTPGLTVDASERRPFQSTVPGMDEQSLSGWRITLSDPDGVASFSTLVGGACGAAPSSSMLPHLSTTMAERLRGSAPVANLLRPWRRRAALALRRLRAVGTVLATSHARLAAGLMQGSLFSNRNQHGVTPQLLHLEAARARLRVVTTRMRGVSRVRLEEVALAFLVHRRRS